MALAAPKVMSLTMYRVAPVMAKEMHMTAKPFGMTEGIGQLHVLKVLVEAPVQEVHLRLARAVLQVAALQTAAHILV